MTTCQFRRGWRRIQVRGWDPSGGVDLVEVLDGAGTPCVAGRAGAQGVPGGGWLSNRHCWWGDVSYGRYWARQVWHKALNSRCRSARRSSGRCRWQSRMCTPSAKSSNPMRDQTDASLAAASWC